MSETALMGNRFSRSENYRALVGEAPSLLSSVIEELGYEIRILDDGGKRVAVSDLEDVAIGLSQLVGKVPAWGWRYLQGVLNGSIGASVKLVQAIMEWGAVLDGQPAVLANTVDASVRAREGQLHPGAVVLAGSTRCGHQGCKVAFVPRVPWQFYCCDGCRKKARRG